MNCRILKEYCGVFWIVGGEAEWNRIWGLIEDFWWFSKDIGILCGKRFLNRNVGQFFALKYLGRIRNDFLDYSIPTKTISPRIPEFPTLFPFLLFLTTKKKRINSWEIPEEVILYLENVQEHSLYVPNIQNIQYKFIHRWLYPELYPELSMILQVEGLFATNFHKISTIQQFPHQIRFEIIELWSGLFYAHIG